jgi:hypothetical protein
MCAECSAVTIKCYCSSNVVLRVQRATTDVLTACCFDEIYCVRQSGLIVMIRQGHVIRDVSFGHSAASNKA